MRRIKMQVPPDIKDPDMWKRFALYQLIYSLFGKVVGLICIIGGIFLFVHGIAGSESWTAKITKNTIEFSDVPSGVALFIAGVFIIFFTRFTIEVRK